MGSDLVRDMFANATKWKLNTVRLYAHTTDPDHPFMVPPPSHSHPLNTCFHCESQAHAKATTLKAVIQQP